MTAKMIRRKCACCKTEFSAREADVRRGWGRFCSKSCKAKKQEARTGQYADYLHRKNRRSDGYADHDEGKPFAMSHEELSFGGYGDSDEFTPFHDGKF